MHGQDYREKFYEKGLDAIQQSLHQLDNHYDVIVLEGAGSPVELNLKDRELVNMKVAGLADVPVLLVADIDRGGVFASIVGTLELLQPTERARVKGIIVNKFRGNAALFAEGISWIEKNTGIPVLGLIPCIEHRIEGEDSLSERHTEPVSTSSKAYDHYDNLAEKLAEHLNWQEIIDIFNRWDKQ
jgi:adenosylcobyric acid synthase